MKVKYDKEEIHCAFEGMCTEKMPEEKIQPMVKNELVTGQEVHAKFAQAFFGHLSVTRLYVITALHVVELPGPVAGSKVPIVDEAWVNTMFQVANDIWSQACIELVPYPGLNVTTFRDIGLSAFAGLCLSPGQFEMVEPYDIIVPGVIVVNVYLVEDTNGIACGSPVSGRIFLPTAGRSPEFMGRVFAHELGHVMLNPIGVDDSLNPDHLMFHAASHPEIPPGSRDGLFLSECYGARTTANENLFVFARPGGLGSPGEAVSCQLSPRLGNNLVMVIPKDQVAAPF